MLGIFRAGIVALLCLAQVYVQALPFKAVREVIGLSSAHAQSMPFPGPGSQAFPVLTYQTTAISTAATSSYSFAGLSIGAAATDRFVIGCFTVMGGTVGTLSSATIAGSTATALVTLNAPQDSTGCYGLTVTSGTTATFVINVGANGARAAVSVYTVLHLNSTTPTTTCTASAGAPLQCTLSSVSGGGVAIALASGNYSSVAAISWTGLTIDGTSSTGGSPYSSASGTFGPTQTNLVPSATMPGAPGNLGFVAFSMR